MRVKIYKDNITDEFISEQEYNRMDDISQSDYHYYKTVNVENGQAKDENGDVLLSAVIGAATDSALLGGILGGSFLGGAAGDLMDGDLFD